MADVGHYRDLRVYQRAFGAAMRIFDLSREWPREERYALIDQVRRSSRSVSANIAEAWRKRRYVSHFVSKLSDADSEAAETQTWIEFAAACGYIPDSVRSELSQIYELINGGLVKMMAEPDKWCGPATMVKEENVEYETDAR